MDWKDIAGVVGKVAPILGTLVGGPAGTVIGALVAGALGTANTPDAIKAAIATDPEAALKLASLEADNRVKLQAMLYAHADALIQADSAAYLADAGDRKSARDREVAVRGMTPMALAWLVVTASMALAGAVVTGNVTKDPGQAALVGTVIGYVFGEAKQVLNYIFGSSAGSERKTELLAKSTPAAEPNVASAP